MTQSNNDLVNLARKGDAHAITTLINNVTQPKNIITNVSIKGDCIQLLFESQEAPRQEVMEALARKILDSLKIDGADRVKLYGRKKGDAFTEWEVEFVINGWISNQQSSTENTSAEKAANTSISRNYSAPANIKGRP